MATVLGRDFDVTGEWATLGVLRDNFFALLCLMSIAPICQSVIL